MNRFSLAALSFVFFSQIVFADDKVGFPETLNNDQIRACVDVLDDGRLSASSECLVTIDGFTYRKAFDAAGDFAQLYLMDPPVTLSGTFSRTAGEEATYTISAPSVPKTAQMILIKGVAP